MAYKPRILIIDIETAPALSYHWEWWQTDIVAAKQSWYILSYAYKWYGEKTIHTVALPDFKGYDPKEHDDYKLCQSLFTLLEQADLFVAHNGDGFDLKKIFSRFLVHRLGQPKPFKTVDTLKILRARFGFLSNKLAHICRELNIGDKLPTEGKDTWLGCMNGDEKAWKIMRRYNAHDVYLLDKVYELIRGWARPSQHTNLNLLTGEIACPKCSSQNYQRRGKEISVGGRIILKHQCQDCGGWWRFKTDEKVPGIIALN